MDGTLASPAHRHVRRAPPLEHSLIRTPETPTSTPGPLPDPGASSSAPKRGGRRRAAEPPPAPKWADRGWYVAVEYGVMARDRFLSRLPRLRQLGTFKELLEPGGTIVYRNIFRPGQLQDAWELFTALRPWQERLVCYVSGELVAPKAILDSLWCAAFLQKERPCRGGVATKGRPAGCEGARVLLGPGSWDETSAERRHVLTFGKVDAAGVLRFDRAAIAEFARAGQSRTLCPGSPSRDPEAFARAFDDVEVRRLDWPLVAELAREVERKLGKALEGEHGFVLKKGEPELLAHAQVELGYEREKVVVRRIFDGVTGKVTIAQHVRVPAAVVNVLKDGVPLRGVRLSEGFVRLEGGHYEVEQRFVLSPRVHLGPTDDPTTFKGYALETHPRATPEYEAWVDRVAGALP